MTNKDDGQRTRGRSSGAGPGRRRATVQRENIMYVNFGAQVSTGDGPAEVVEAAPVAPPQRPVPSEDAVLRAVKSRNSGALRTTDQRGDSASRTADQRGGNSASQLGGVDPAEAGASWGLIAFGDVMIRVLGRDLLHRGELMRRAGHVRNAHFEQGKLTALVSEDRGAVQGQPTSSPCSSGHSTSAVDAAATDAATDPAAATDAATDPAAEKAGTGAIDPNAGNIDPTGTGPARVCTVEVAFIGAQRRLVDLLATEDPAHLQRVIDGGYSRPALNAVWDTTSLRMTCSCGASPCEHVSAAIAAAAAELRAEPMSFLQWAGCTPGSLAMLVATARTPEAGTSQRPVPAKTTARPSTPAQPTPEQWFARAATQPGPAPLPALPEPMAVNLLTSSAQPLLMQALAYVTRDDVSLLHVMAALEDIYAYLAELQDDDTHPHDGGGDEA